MRPAADVPRSSVGVCYPLREDLELADVVEPDGQSSPAGALAARQIELAPGAWEDRPAAPDTGIGLLVLQGVLVHRVGINDRYGAELLGEGDLLRRPQDELPSSLTPSDRWLVLEPARIAVLDERFMHQLGSHPELGSRLFARAVLRARQLAVNMAIVHQARVDTRLHLLLWHIAGRWGRVRSDGVVVPLRLTHNVLAELVAARRPTVTSALSELSRRGLVHSVTEGWLLRGDPPGEIDGPAEPATEVGVEGRAAPPRSADGLHATHHGQEPRRTSRSRR